MNGLYSILLALGGFLLGSIMFCKLIPQLVVHKNICELSDDGNPGAYNVFKHCGIKLGVVCLLLDILKGFLPVFIASLFLNTDSILFTFVLIAPVVGHALGMFNHFVGGKCISTSFGVMIGLLPVSWIGLVSLAVLFVLFSTLFKIKSRNRRTVVVYALFAITSCVPLLILRLPYIAVSFLVIAMLPIVRITFEMKKENKTSIEIVDDEDALAEESESVVQDLKL